MMGQYWLGKTKLSDQPEALVKSFYKILKNYLLMTDWLTNQLTN